MPPLRGLVCAVAFFYIDTAPTGLKSVLRDDKGFCVKPGAVGKPHLPGLGKGFCVKSGAVGKPHLSAWEKGVCVKPGAVGNAGETPKKGIARIDGTYCSTSGAECL